jgi:hypothetical protein
MKRFVAAPFWGDDLWFGERCRAQVYFAAAG